MFTKKIMIIYLCSLIINSNSILFFYAFISLWLLLSPFTSFFLLRFLFLRVLVYYISWISYYSCVPNLSSTLFIFSMFFLSICNVVLILLWICIRIKNIFLLLNFVFWYFFRFTSFRVFLHISWQRIRIFSKSY